MLSLADITTELEAAREECKGEDRMPDALTAKELAVLQPILRRCEEIARMELDRKPKRGGIVYALDSLLMLYIYMELHKMTFKGAVKGAEDSVFEAFGFPMKADRTVRRPSVGTLNHFANHVLPEMCEGISNEVVLLILAGVARHRITIDSTPLEASRYSKVSRYSVHYDIRMDKCHMIMVCGIPVAAVYTGGLDGDNPELSKLLEAYDALGFGIVPDAEFLSDGGYDSFESFADVYLKVGVVMGTHLRSNAVFHEEATWGRIQNKYSQLRKRPGFDPNRKNDEDFVIRFLCHNGQKELVGKYLRNKSLALEIERARQVEIMDGDGELIDEGLLDPVEKSQEKSDTRREVCENVHRSYKSWVRFEVRGLRYKTRWVRARCRLLCCQIMMLLFPQYDLVD